MQRQLNLFKGKRQRGDRAPVPLEFALHAAFADAVRISLDRHWRFTHIPLGEFRMPETAGRLKRMGVMPGWPDFIFVGPQRVAFIELKRPGGSMAREQIDVAAHLASCGCSFLCTDSVGDALAFLRDLGAVRSTVMA